MEKNNFDAIMPYISADLIAYISKEKNISEDKAMKKLYSSNLYSILEKEDTKLWQYSTPMLYSLIEQEEKYGDISFPDV